MGVNESQQRDAERGDLKLKGNGLDPQILGLGVAQLHSQLGGKLGGQKRGKKLCRRARTDLDARERWPKHSGDRS